MHALAVSRARLQFVVVGGDFPTETEGKEYSGADIGHPPGHARHGDLASGT